MNQEVDYYAEAEKEVKGGTNPSWTGIVGGYALKSVTMNDKGSAVLEFHQVADEKGYSTKTFINAIDFDTIQVYEGNTKEATIINALRKETHLFKDLARNYSTEEAVDATFKGAKTLQDKVNALNSCLPANVAEVTGRVVIGYSKLNANGKSYLTIPNKMQWDSEAKEWLPFFTTNPAQKLCALPANLTLNKPQPSTEVPAEDVAVVEY